MTVGVTGLSLLFVLAVGATPTESADATDPSSEAPAIEERCEAIFGDAAAHVENHRARIQRIESVIQMGEHADILYFEDADEPSIMSIKGMTLVS